MSQIQTQIGEIAYNPARECFEALVTFHSEFGRRRVAASFAAPLTADFDRVSDGLLRAGLAGLNLPDQLQSRLAPVQAAPACQDAPLRAA